MENGKKNFLSNKFTSLNDINNDSGRNLAVNSADPALYPPMQEAPLNLSMHRVPTTQTRPNDTNHSLSQNPIVNPVNLTPEFSISSILPTQRITKESTRKRKLEKTDLSDMNQKIPKVTEKGQMPSFFIDITEPKSYGLEKSEYGNNTVYHQSRSTNNPNYPITALNYNNNMLSSYMQKTINDSSKTLEERKKEIYKKVIGENLYGNIKLNLQGLSSFKMPGSTVKKLFYVNGKLIADIINRKNDSGHVIKRVIEPMSGSAIYSNWIRLLGFKGKIIINDTNPFVILTQKAIINYPDEVLKNIEVIKNDILNIAQKHGLNFNSELFIESNSSNINQTIKKNFRENIIYYFEESLIMLTSSVSDNGRLILDIPQDPILAKHFNAYAAALYYIAQNSFHFKDDSSIDVKLNTPDTYVFNLPISIFVEQKNKTRIFPSIINHQKIKFINHIHKNTKEDTEFFNEDGWALLKRKNIGAGDLIILSDYLNNKYTNENEFYQKIKDDVIPAIQRGAQVLVINKFQKEIETFLKRQGFQVEKNENKGNPTLLALSPNIDTTQLQTQTQTQTQTHKLQSTYIDFLSDLYITQPKLSEPNRTITNTETLFEGQIIVELEKDRVVSEAAKKLAGLYITQPGLSKPNRTITNAETRFAGQIIVELEEDRVVSDAAKRLAGKHAERSLIIQLKKEGGYEVVKGNPYLLRGDLRWQVVGHSREGGNEGYPGTFGGASAEQLSNQLIALHAQLKKQFRINPRPKYISLVGCSLAAAGVEDRSYAQHFGKALKHQAGWQTDIGARRLPVTVNAQGRKLSVVNEAASEKMPDKVVLSWTPEGELVVQKTRFSDRASGVLAPETLSSWEPPLDSLVEPRSAVASLQTGLGDVPPALDRSSDAGEISLSRKALHQMGAMVEGQPFSPEHFTKENGVQKLRFDAQRLAFYLHHADGGELSTQQAVRFLKQQLDVKSPPSLLEGDDKASTMVALEQLNRINEHVQRGAPAPMTSSLDIPPALWGSLKSVLAPAGGARLNRLSARAGFGMQGYGYLRGLRDLKNYRDLLNKGGLTETQKEELIFQHHLAIASFSSNIGIDATQSGLGQYGRRLVQNGISSGVGMNVARFGGPVLGALSSGFDMVQAYRAFSELPSTAEPKARQDLIVNGALSVAGATLNIGMAIAFAVGGQASLLAGPAGLIMGGGLVLGGMIYSAVRQVEELKKWVQLSVLEELDSGWRLFSGEYLAPELANQASRHQMLAHAQAEHQKAQTAQFQTLLLSHGQIDKVYGSLGQILLTPQRYKKIVAHHAGMEEDRVHPDEITQGKRALSDKLNRLKSNLLISGEMTVVDSDYEYYSPTLTSRDDRSDADIMMTLSAGHRQSLGRFVDENTQSLTASLEMKGRHRAPSALGDFNGDGRPDIGYFSPEGLFFLFADENGAYGPVKKMDTKNTFYHGLYANHVRHLVGDINGDGLDDIMFFLDSGDAVQILLGQPTEDFVFKEIKGVKLPALSQAAPVLTDVNGDGHPDWVSFVKNSLYVHYGDAGKMLGMPEEVSHPDAPLHSAQYLHHLAGDINGDGLGDILSVTRDGQLETRLGSRTPGQPLRRLANQTQAAVQGFGGVFNPSQLQLHDMNGDGRSDLVVIQDDGSYTMSYGQAEGTLGEASDDKSREEQGAKVAYRPNLLAKQNEQKIVGIRQGAVHLELISLNEQGEVHAHPFESRRERDLIAYYKLGDGEDEMTGQPSRRNYFDVGGGTKKFTGGSCADTFLLQGQQAPSQPGHFNGAGPIRAEEGEKDDQDTVIAAVKPANGRGYQIDLHKGEVKYVGEDTKIATLENIEHAIGHRETNDILIGDDRNNHLEGAGGSDTLSGQGGNDILSLSSGTATGGEGIDSYRILQNNRAADTLTEIEVKETVGQHDTSNIILDYNAANVMSLSLKDTESGGDMVLTLRNDNQSLTEVRFKNMYGPAQGKTRALQHHYFLYTRDGMFITGFPETLMQQADGRWPVPPLILDNFHQKELLMGTGMAHHYVVENAVLKRDIVIYRHVMPHHKDDPLIQDRVEVPWLLQETVFTTDKDDVVLSPVGDTHASVRIKHFIKEAPDRPLSLVDLNGDVAAVEVNEEGLVSIGRPEGTDQNDTVRVGHGSDLKDNRLNLEAESPGPVSKVSESDVTAGRLPESMAGFASSQSDSLASQAEPLHRHWNPLNPAAGKVATTVIHP